MLGKDELNPEVTINEPVFNKDRSNEDDIYVFSGYVKPGTHSIHVFDPQSKKFYKSQPILIRPREKGIKTEKFAHTNLGELIDDFYSHGNNYKALASYIFGHLPHDFGSNIGLRAYERDFRGSTEINDLVKENYKTVNSLYKVMQVECPEPSIQDFSKFVSPLFAETKSITKSDFD